MGDIIQFTSVHSMSTRSFIKVNAHTVGFHITHSFTKLPHRDFNDANHVVHEAFAIKLFFRPELQSATLIGFREFFENRNESYLKCNKR